MQMRMLEYIPNGIETKKKQQKHNNNNLENFVELSSFILCWNEFLPQESTVEIYLKNHLCWKIHEIVVPFFSFETKSNSEFSEWYFKKQTGVISLSKLQRYKNHISIQLSGNKFLFIGDDPIVLRKKFMLIYTLCNEAISLALSMIYTFSLKSENYASRLRNLCFSIILMNGSNGARYAQNSQKLMKRCSL